ncbi:MAG: XdhC family protein [Gemmatimonadetes bacterium]|nr:XdhC family protein [Gemmatimonadota bacterium]
MDLWLDHAAALSRAGTPFVLATIVAREAPQSVRVGAHAFIHADGRVEGWIGGGCLRPTVVREALAALAERRPRLLRLNPAAEPDPREDVRVFALTCQGEGAVDVYLEPVLPAPVLVVLGATPVAESLARIAPEAGLDVVRVDVVSPVAGGDVVAELAGRIRAAGDAGRRHVVVATMGEADEEVLEAAVAAGGAYIGLVASRKKAESLRAHLRARGVPAEAAARVKAPAGLDLGGSEPGEIALSVVAEVVRARHAGGAAARAGLPIARPAAAGAAAAPATDPVCGMAVDPATARHTLELADGRTVYFCCPHCRAAFEREPERYLAPAG